VKQQRRTKKKHLPAIRTDTVRIAFKLRLSELQNVQ
jgi:hypothetical protein